MKTEDFLSELITITNELIASTREFLTIDPSLLIVQPSPNKWSISECYEHLNLTLGIYLPQIQEILKFPEKYPVKGEEFKHSVLGRLAVKSMQPKPDESIKFKMKTFQILKPAPSNGTSKISLGKFLDYQDQTIEVLEKAKNIDLKKPKINSAAGPILKMGVGDALHFIIAHNQRHVLQAQKVLQIIQ